MAARPGRTWPPASPKAPIVNSVKEDPQAKGLLYAATELRVYVSFNDGEQWQPLQNNMPVTSVRDIVVHGDDLDVATYGRGFWVMDQMSAAAANRGAGRRRSFPPAPICSNPARLYAIRNGGMNGTPLPHEEPQELNPPSGVVAYYWLKTAAAQPLKLELLDGSGAVRACAASDTPVRPVDTGNLERSGDLGTARASRLRPLPECIASLWARPPDAAVVEAVSDAVDAAPAVDACTPAGGAPAVAANPPAGGRGRGGRGGGGGGGGGGGRGGAGDCSPANTPCGSP